MATLNFADALEFIGKPTIENPIWGLVEPREGEQIIGLDEFSVEYPDLGLELSFLKIGGKISLKAIHFFSNKADLTPHGTREFVGILPKEISFNSTKGEIIEQLGKPDAIGGDIVDDLLGYREPWIKYYYGGHSQLFLSFQGNLLVYCVVSDAI